MGGEDGEKVDQRQERLSIMGERKKILKGKINISKFNHYRENIYFSKKKRKIILVFTVLRFNDKITILFLIINSFN